MTLLNWNFTIPNQAVAHIVYAAQAATFNLTCSLAFLQRCIAIVMPMDPFGLQHPRALQRIRAPRKRLRGKLKKHEKRQCARTKLVLYFSVGTKLVHSGHLQGLPSS